MRYCDILSGDSRIGHAQDIDNQIHFKITHLNSQHYLNWLMQERLNSIANALELRLSCTNPSISEEPGS